MWYHHLIVEAAQGTEEPGSFGTQQRASGKPGNKPQSWKCLRLQTRTKETAALNPRDKWALATEKWTKRGLWRKTDLRGSRINLTDSEPGVARAQCDLKEGAQSGGRQRGSAAPPAGGTTHFRTINHSDPYGAGYQEWVICWLTACDSLSPGIPAPCNVSFSFSSCFHITYLYGKIF